MRAIALLTMAVSATACVPPKAPSVEAEAEATKHTSCDGQAHEGAAPSAPSPAAATPPVAAASESTLPPPAVVLGEASPPPAAAPTVAISSPARGAHVDADAKVTLDVRGWPTAEGAAHVHLILDNQPYKPIYDTAAPVALRDLNGGKDLAPGPHVLVAFASRANHESVKAPSAIAVSGFVVGPEPATFAAPASFLVYSRPKGTYAGAQANHVLVDFQLVGVTLAEGKREVALEVRGETLAEPLRARTSRFGSPFYLENLRSGSYTLELTLLDGGGNVIEGAWNKTTRTIVLDRSKKP